MTDNLLQGQGDFAPADNIDTPAIPNGFTKLGLAPELLKAVEDLGYTQPTTVQEKAIPLAMDTSAEGEASTLADVLVNRIKGGEPPAPFKGRVICYIEMGDATISRVDVDFLSGPAPTALFSPPSLEAAEEKRQFAATRRQRWFGVE